MARRRSVTPVVDVNNELQLFVSLKDQKRFSDRPTVRHTPTPGFKASEASGEHMAVQMFDLSRGEVSPLAKKLATDTATTTFSAAVPRAF